MQVTSKLWATRLHDVESALDESLSNLGLDYLDRTSSLPSYLRPEPHSPPSISAPTVYLVHWPIHLNPNGNHPSFPTLPNGHRDVVHDWPLRETWKQLEAMVKKGKVRAIGVSNCSERTLETEILPYAEIPPAVDQVELHLYNPQHALLAYLKSKGILPQAYSPLGSTGSPLLKDDVAAEIAKRHGLAVADVLLGWQVASGVVTLPKSVTPARIKANIEGAVAASQKLTPDDIEKLNAVAASGKAVRCVQLFLVLIPTTGVSVAD